MNPSEKTPASEVAAPRKRISWLAWVMTILVACCFLVMNSRGELKQDSIEYVVDSKTKQTIPTCRYSHGWPMIWVESEPENTPSGLLLKRIVSLRPFSGLPIPDIDDAWLTDVTSVSVNWFACAINFLVAAFVLVIVFFTCRFRSKRRQGFRFSLLEVSALMLLTSVAFANFQYHRSLSAKENATISESGGLLEVNQYQWQHPSAIRALVGKPEWMNAYRHVDQFQFKTKYGQEDSVTEKLDSFAFANSVRIVGDPSMSQMESLSMIQGLKSIEVRTDSLDPSSLSTGPELEAALSGLTTLRGAQADYGEGYESRIQQPNAVFRSVTELSINSQSISSGGWKNWPRSLDFVSCCPNLKKITLVGDQYLMDDLMNVPVTVEEINFGFPATLESVEKLQKKYPGAVINPVRGLPGKVLSNRRLWEDAQIRVNRRRSLGWAGSQFGKQSLDLSSTDVDREFLQKLSPIFPNTRSIHFGSFDSVETAIWLTQQCPKLKFVKTNGYPLGFNDAMRLPRSIEWFVVEQGSISADDFAKLALELELKELKINLSNFTDEEVEEIRAAVPDCRVRIRKTSRRGRILSK